MYNIKKIKIQACNSLSNIETRFLDEISESLEDFYRDDYFSRIQALEKVLITAFIIFSDENPIGFRLIIEADGKPFGESKTVMRGTMYRIIPSYRNMGIGFYAYKKTNDMLFKEFDLERIYGATKEFGALKLYNRVENIVIIKNQHSNNTIIDDNFISLPLPNQFRMAEDIIFYAFRQDN